MITRTDFHQLWPSVLMLFQLLGYATYSTPARTRLQHFRRTAYAVVVIVALSAFSAYALLTRIRIHQIDQVNVMSDQSVYLTLLPGHLIVLIEALLRHQTVHQLFEQMYDIAALLSATSGGNTVTIDFVRIQRQQLLTNWLQFGGLSVLVLTGVMLTGTQSWIYFRWILLAQMLVCGRLLEVAMHVEVLGELMAELERLLLAEAAIGRKGGDGSRVGRAGRLHDAIEIYGRVYRLAGGISEAFSWSMLVICVFGLNGMINTSFWFMFILYTGAVQIYDQMAMIVFFATNLARLFGACEACSTLRTRIAVALFDMPNEERCGDQSRIVREFARQMWHEPIRITVLDGILVLDYRLFGSMLSIVVTYTIILMQFQQDEGKFNVVNDLY